MTIRDKSEFLRGVLVLIKSDGRISVFEERMALIIGKSFGFAEDFCKSALGDLLENEFISAEPPIFSSQTTAQYFIDETSRIFSQIRNFSEKDLKWITETAETNNVKFNPLYYTEFN